MLRPSVSEILVVALALLSLSSFPVSVQRVEASALDHLESMKEDWKRFQHAREPAQGLERRSFTSQDQSGACSAGENGQVRFACPLSRDATTCIADDALCNGRYDCPRQEDEHSVVCLFYKFISSQMRAAIRTASSQNSS